MKKQIIAVAVISLFCTLAISPCINGNSEVKITAVKDYNQRFNFNEIENKLKELRVELNEFNDDCGCNDVNPTPWNFPALCLLLAPLFWLGVGLLVQWGSERLFNIMVYIGELLNCSWF